MVPVTTWTTLYHTMVGVVIVRAKFKRSVAISRYGYVAYEITLVDFQHSISWCRLGLCVNNDNFVYPLQETIKTSENLVKKCKRF